MYECKGKTTLEWKRASRKNWKTYSRTRIRKRKKKRGKRKKENT